MLRTSAVPIVPAVPLDRRPSGLTRAHGLGQARAASRSSTALVPSGVASRGPKPVPPVVTISPWNPSVQPTQLPAHGLDSVRDRRPLDHRPAGICQVVLECLAAAILPGALDHAVGHGEHLGPQVELAVCSVSRHSLDHTHSPLPSVAATELAARCTHTVHNAANSCATPAEQSHAVVVSVGEQHGTVAVGQPRLWWGRQHFKALVSGCSGRHRQRLRGP